MWSEKAIEAACNTAGLMFNNKGGMSWNTKMRDALDAAAAVDGDPARITQAYENGRNAGIEESAKKADKVGEKDAFMKGMKAIDALAFSHTYAEAEQGRQLADAIRALKRP